MKDTTETLWVAVVDASYARLFEATIGTQHPVDRPPRLVEFETLAHPESRLPRRELAVAEGETRSPGGAVHAFSPHQDPRLAERDRFAHDVAHHLNRARAAGDFGRLALVAAPAMLGLLRHHLDVPTQRLVVAEVGKRLGHARPDEVRDELPRHLFD